LNRGRTGAAEQPAPSEEAKSEASQSPRRRGTRAATPARAGTRRTAASVAPKGEEVPAADTEAQARPRRAARPATANAPSGRRPRGVAQPSVAPGARVADADTEAEIATALRQRSSTTRARKTGERVLASTAAEGTPEAQAAAGQTPEGEATQPPRGRRGVRGGGRRTATDEQDAASSAEVAAPTEPETPAAETQERRPRERGGRGRGDRGRRDGRSPGTSRIESASAPSRDYRGGSVESLIARQNVLFEDFAQQQQQTLRDIQRAVAGRGGASNAVAPIVLPKVGVFLDVPNLVFAADDAGLRVHFGKLLDYLTQGRQLVRATAYAPITDDPNTRFENQRFVHPVLGYGYKVVTKPWKRFTDGGMKANFDIELAVDILTMSDRLDIVVLLSGDSDFKRVIELVESKGVRVEVCAFAQSTASELKAVADQYIDLGSILQYISP
jgi:uncharacterized LabA/DUF88 family protein